ncbi:MAG: HDOD domain-containing protein [Thermodesulfovibrionales bacterium]|nr:HDOD domain-containing protein [Thermodesulfovibrionales bacterium]
MSTESKTFKDLKVFDDVAEKELVSLFSILPQKKIKQDEVLLKEGSAINSLYMVINGSLRVEKREGEVNYVVYNLNNGNIFGVLPQNKNYVTGFTVIANEPSTVLIMNEKSISLLKPATKERVLFNVQSLDYLMNVALMDEIVKERQRCKLFQHLILNEYNQRRDITLNSPTLQEAIKKIPSLPAYTYELAGLLTKQTVSSDKVVDYIKSDPSLMALVLKTVNSPLYSLSQKVTDFHHAVLLLGFSQIYQIVIDNSLNNVMPNKPEFIELRDRALMVSTLAFEIAMLCGYDRPLLLSTIGTLHILGEVVKGLLKKETDFAEALSLFDDAVIASEVLKNWKMPEIIYKSIGYYKYPDFADPTGIPSDVLKTVSMLHLAIGCFEFLKNPNRPVSAFAEEYLKSLSISGSLDDIIMKRIIPNLKKRFELLPKAVQFILKDVKIV